MSGFDQFQQKLGDNSRSREPSPNRGQSVPETDAIPPHRESQAQWRERNNIDPAKQIRLVKVSHMRYRHPDLALITKFLRDFGMHVVKKTETQAWFRGYGNDQYVYYAEKGEKAFLGGTFEVESYADLEKAATLPNAGTIEKMDDAPGGGYFLRLTDPEGFIINLIYGQTPAELGQLPTKLIVNDVLAAPRVREFQRFKPGPAAVHKLGHYGLCVKNFPAQVDWYTRNFNLMPTDILYVPDENAKNAEMTEGRNSPKPAGVKDVAIFCHIDRGQDLVDHHTFFMSSNKTAHVHHCSFEVHDFDTQNLGHQWLAAQGYESVWGVGRHILGSQIFDYWWDVHHNMIEHYADGDLINFDTPIGYGPAGDESLAVWGPEVPKWFLD